VEREEEVQQAKDARLVEVLWEYNRLGEYQSKGY
jgi:hypothetical protein